MSVSDLIISLVFAPLLIGGVWIVVIRVWRLNMEVTEAVSWFTGERGKGVVGYHAFLGPAAICMTAIWIGVLGTFIKDGMKSPPDWLGPAIGVCFGIGILFMLIGFWMWTFRWPQFLVPPAFRKSRIRHDEHTV